MNVYKPGTAVRLDGDIPGRITLIRISLNGAVYQISWFNGSTHYEESFFEFEFEVGEKAERERIGWL